MERIIKTFERSTRDTSYERNLVKEERLTEVFINWCKINGISYKVNPTDSTENKAGCDIEIWGSSGNANDINNKMYIDLKGCQNKYANICLSYERSYDGKRWFSTLNNRTTTDYVFIDEFDNMLWLPKDELVQNIQNFKTVNVSPSTAGHWQRCVLIPKCGMREFNILDK